MFRLLLTFALFPKFHSCRAVLVFFVFILFTPLLPAAQNRYDVLVTEFLPDPSPAVGLPASSFVELYNRSSQDFNLHNWKIGNGSNTTTIKSSRLLKADSFLILCSTTAASAYERFGPVLGISGFPSLYNDAGNIILSNEAGQVIHAIHYDKSWFDNDVKAQGGWSLEMIDPASPCKGEGNWTASESPAGGTPGSRNSVDAPNPDRETPILVRTVARDSVNLVLIFDEPVDSSAAATPSHYNIQTVLPTDVQDTGISVESSFAVPPFFDRIELHLKNAMQVGKLYTVSAQNTSDCSGNINSTQNIVRAGLPERVDPGDIIFNEILFNPPPYGNDYLELYNRSGKIISCSALYLAGRDIIGNLKDPVALVNEDRDFFPGEYLVLTENPNWVLHQYPMAVTGQMLKLSAMPSLPDDNGKAVLLNTSGDIVDELDYDHQWHSPMLVNESGVSLERIRTDQPTSLASNWTSAAADAGFGTPGYKNSESFIASPGFGYISVEPKIFSPDLDGYRDFCFINYQLPAAGFTGSISIYDISGRMVRKLVNNGLWSTSGSYRWDGLDDEQNLLPMGHYIIYIELFLPSGTVKKIKKVCVLARRN